ncbi:MAG TPA: TetR/AcrR family transcriptional regulator [Solirubrobacteraceae bacterium]|nr:TetR/AcrR family transcriptional regulator [Solirubrobacteraceae bacterium]
MTARLRMTRAERSEQTRAELVAAARTVFLRRGFHGASLDEISAEAGYTTGAVYSRFGGKDELFLAVLDAHVDRRLVRYREAIDGSADFASAGRELVRAAIAAGRGEPGWTPLLMEFWTHAARRDELRAAVLERHDRQLDVLAGLYEQVVARDGASFTRPPREVLQACTALARGLGLERQLAPDAGLEQLYEHYAMALTEAFIERRSTP